MTIIHKSGKRHSDADCLSRAPVGLAPADDDDSDDAALIGVLDAPTISEQQRADPELRSLFDFLQGHTTVVPKAFARGLSPFCLRSNVLYKRNFASSGSNYLLVVPSTSTKCNVAAEPMTRTMVEGWATIYLQNLQCAITARAATQPLLRRPRRLLRWAKASWGIGRLGVPWQYEAGVPHYCIAQLA